MKRVWTLVAAAAVALSTSAHVARAVPANPEAAVVSLSVVPATGRAELVIGVDGPVQVNDFTLDHPNKIVVDITGASLGLPAGDYYDRVARGGIVNVRYSQFRRNIVRVVVTLDGPRAYKLQRGASEVRVAVQGAADDFRAWRLNAGAERPLARATVRVETDDHPASNSLAVLAVPAAPAVPATPAVPAVPAAFTAHTKSAPPAQQPAQQQPRITITWQDADIRDVLAAFAAFSGRTIIPSKDVSGKITAEIQNQPWDVAMRAILNANGFDATADANGIIIVDTFERIAARAASVPLATRTIRLNYARAVSVAPVLEQRLSRNCRSTAPAAAATPGAAAPGAGGAPGATGAAPSEQMVADLTCPRRGAVTADSLTNSLIITDIPSNLDALEANARSMDLRQPQVNIKAKIILVDKTQLEGLGLRYDIGTPEQFFNDIIPRNDSTGKPRTDKGQVLLGGNTIAAIANATQRVPGAALQLVYSTALGAFNFSTFIEALQQVSLVDVQAEPSASVLNNRQANLQSGTQVPIRTIDVSAGGSATGSFPRALVRMEQTGVILTVTPQITANRQVQMRVHVENSDVQDRGGDIGAVFPKQQVDNEILVADGETAVMGGLTQTSITISKSGIPLLVDLPMIGRLFGVTNRTERKVDLLILITPHIIDDGQQPPADNRD